MARLLILVLITTACTTRKNPLDCADGACSDPSLPFCDVGGEVRGQANTCIAVDCIPGEIETCRGDELIRCDVAGLNFDVVLCERGCDPDRGCFGCATNTQCANPAPVCDETSHECRACVLDEECTSDVCSNGACVVESTIAYASATGSGSSCTKLAPCSAASAIAQAVAAVPPKTVRLLPGTYAETVQVNTATTSALEIVGTGATIANATGALILTDGANVLARGGTYAGEVTCGPAGSFPRSGASLRDLNVTGRLIIDQCDVVIERVTVETSTGVSFGATSSPVIRMDRVQIRRNAPSSITIVDATVTITNSVLELPLRLGTGSSLSTIQVGFNTIALAPGDFQDCRNGFVPFNATFENNIVFAAGPPAGVGGNAVAGGPGCTFRNNVITPQPTTLPTNVVADPQFVNVGARDYHLTMTSPARDAAMPSAALPSDHDLEGVSRPQGSQPDIGAFEFKP